MTDAAKISIQTSNLHCRPTITFYQILTSTCGIQTSGRLDMQLNKIVQSNLRTGRVADVAFPLFATPISPKICPLPWRNLDPYLIHGSLDPPVPFTKQHLDRVSRFSRIFGRYQRTDGQTDRLQNGHVTRREPIAASLANTASPLKYVHTIGGNWSENVQFAGTVHEDPPVSWTLVPTHLDPETL